MSEPLKAPDLVLVACEVCLKEIPRDEASIEEFEDYVMYFCGLDCYRVWRAASTEIDDQLDD